MRTDSRLLWGMSPCRTLVKSSPKAHLEDRLAFALGDVSVQDARSLQDVLAQRQLVGVALRLAEDDGAALLAAAVHLQDAADGGRPALVATAEGQVLWERPESRDGQGTRYMTHTDWLEEHCTSLVDAESATTHSQLTLALSYFKICN